MPEEQSHCKLGQPLLTREAEPVEVRAIPMGLLDSITQGTAARSPAGAEKVRQFLSATSMLDAIGLWLGRVPAAKTDLELARRALSRDIGRIDRLLTDQVNEILHHASFQTLESGWRGLLFMWTTRKMLLTERGLDDKAADIEIRVLNVSKKELVKDFEDAVDFDQNTLFKKVYEEEFGTAGGRPYGLLVANYEFTNHPEDIDLLGQLSGVGAAAFAPVIASAAPALLGLDDFSTLEQPSDLERIFQQPKHRKWRSLREKPDSQFLGLTLPRILMRSP